MFNIYLSVVLLIYVNFLIEILFLRFDFYFTLLQSYWESIHLMIESFTCHSKNKIVLNCTVFKDLKRQTTAARKINEKQECIPVGCAPSTAVAVLWMGEWGSLPKGVGYLPLGGGHLPPREVST